ncbi:MAG: sodium:proton antiporter [Bacteroidales bacterium]|nr:sodium:proton antiporter [Bacteroidales bacterium]
MIIKPGHRTALALVPLAVLVALLAMDISIFGADSILGASQVALLAAAGVCIWLSMWLYKTPWKEFEKAVVSHVGDVAPAIVILLLIGAISGTWTMSGVVPAFICYGVKIISPKVFLLTACILCALVSVLTGSSWTTIATVGVALLGIGRAEGFSDAMTAGAIISGAYFGDKVSPLSDTTILASSVNKVDLFDHIHYMCLTTVPSMIITLIIFTVLGFTGGGTEEAQMGMYTEILSSHFHITPWLMVVPAITVWLIIRKKPAIMVLAISTLVAAAAAMVFQPEVVRRIGEAVTTGSGAKAGFTGVVRMIYDTVSINTGNEVVDQLVTSRGMLGMLNTVFLILCAMCFGACMRSSGMIDDLARILAPLTRTRAGLVGSTVVTGTALNGIVSDQYLSIILTSNIYRESFDREGYERRLMSRSVEDSATVTSPLIPWSSCGMTQATILSVPTLAYAPFCFFNIISPLMSFLVALTGWRIMRNTGKA